MKYAFFLLLAAILIAACSAAPQATPIAAPPMPTATPSADVQIESWVNRPNPTRDQRVNVYATIRVKGVHRGGVTMTAFWPAENHERGVPNCWVRTSYELGVCTIPVDKFPPGEYVPITIIFEFDGVKYTTQTGFTPQP